MRSFLAILPDESNALAIDAWMTQNYAVLPRRVPVQNLHVTLCFLGDINSEQRDFLEDHLPELTIESSMLRLDHVLCQLDSEVLWLGSHASPPELDQLVGQCRQLANRMGVRVDKRRFEPHMTLARRVKGSVPGPMTAPDFSLRVRGIAWMSSSLRRDGAHYELIRYYGK